MSYPDAARFVTPARLRLAAATRRLVDGVLTTFDAPDEELDAAATAVDVLAEHLHTAHALGRDARGADPSTVGAGSRRQDRRHGDYTPRSPLVGEANPSAPPFVWESRGGRVYASGVFTAAFEGPPGYVHGGYLALAFDEVLGFANIAAGYGGLTGRLTVRYRRPTPLHQELRFEAHTERVEGRRLTTVGSLYDGDTLTAEAEGLFVRIGEERALEYFGERIEPREPVDPLP